MPLVLKSHMWHPDGPDRGASMSTRKRAVPLTEKKKDGLTLEGPVAGRPRVMLGREGDVYRDSWLTGPSLPASLCAKDGWNDTHTHKHMHR